MSTGFDRVSEAIRKSGELEEEAKERILKTLEKYKENKANILITGSTGVGKSSTINALFNATVAKIGVGVTPETMDIKQFDMGSLILWDSPGLGDTVEKDKVHSKGIINKLNEKDSNGNLLIDVVLVIIDGSNRDMGTSFELINKVIIPNMSETNRLLIAINKVDEMIQGRNKGWDYESAKPVSEELISRIYEKERSVRDRILEATGVTVEPVSYSAGCTDGNTNEQEKPYNLSKLLCYLLEKLPKDKRIQAIAVTNSTAEVWGSNNDLANYSREVRNAGLDFIRDASIGAVAGEALVAAISTVVPVVAPVALGIKVVTGIVAGAKKFGEWVEDTFCFITTAVCESLGKPDDCYELTMFRGFRDNWLVKQPDGEELVKEYYEVAPKIVEAIDKLPERKEIYLGIWTDWLAPCLELIEKESFDECKGKYVAMVRELQEKYIGNSNGGVSE